ncbi:carbohydrate ABC transporter permease [Microbacterium koreense]|uniref:Carbohydrate ABC transporter permease n=1 Tax=Microbacterium koreense TaxID=323761 RepID=A0ABW2ZMM8_9MICO
MTAPSSLAPRVSGRPAGPAGGRGPAFLSRPRRGGRLHSPRVGLVFVAPFLLFLILFQYIPIAMLLRNSLFDYTLINREDQTFVGFDQYARILTDADALGTFGVTLAFAAGVVLLVLPTGFALALFLNGRFAGRTLVRTIVFLPVVTSVAVTSTMWLFMLTQNGGLVNGLLESLGLPRVAFLSSIPWALISIIVATAWQQIGFVAVLFLTGLQSVPDDIVEAARVDGAGRVRIAVSIILPLMSRSTLFIVITMTVFSLQAFAPAFLMTSGGPQGSTSLVVYSIYIAAFRLQDPGYASALAVVLLLVALVLSGIQSLALRTRWSY